MTLPIGPFFIGLAILALAMPARAQAPLELRPKAPLSKPATEFKQNNPKQAGSIDSTTIVQKANSYFNASSVLTADFIQIGADGRRSEGKLFVSKPGKLRFEYAKPSNLEIIADGTSVAVRDRKLATQDLYLIAQTPLKFLLKGQIDLARDTRILDTKSEASSASLLLEDKATLGGTSQIKLLFDAQFANLKQWQIIDPQGHQTAVSLHNIDRSSHPDSDLFRINTERMLNPN